MDAIRIAAYILIAAGIFGLVYGSFTYTKETHQTKLGPIELSVKDKETVNIPVWAGVGRLFLAVGCWFLAGRRVRRRFGHLYSAGEAIVT